MDDRTSGLIIRALLRRRGWTQAELAARTRVSQSTVSRGERGWLEELTLRTTRALFAALEALGWTAELGVTYSEYGEHRSIDVLGLRPADRAVVVVEVKAVIASSEAIGRKLGEKARLARRIVLER